MALEGFSKGIGQTNNVSNINTNMQIGSGNNVQRRAVQKRVGNESMGNQRAIAAPGVDNRQLIRRLESFSRDRMAQYEQGMVAKAEEDAYRDAENGNATPSKSVLTSYGRTYNRVITADYAAKANIQIVSKSIELKNKFANDPSAYDANMGEFIKGYKENAPTSELASVISISGSKVRTAGFGDLSIAENQRIKEGQVQTFAENIGVVTNQIIELNAQGKEGDAQLAADANILYVNAMVNEGLIDEATGMKVIKDAKFKITSGSDNRALENILSSKGLAEGKEFLDSKTAENRIDMDVNEQKKYNSDLKSIYNTSVKQAKAGRAMQVKYGKSVVKNAIYGYKNGKSPDDPAAVDQAKLALDPVELKELELYEKAHSVISQFDELSLSQKRAKYEEYKMTSTSNRLDVEVENQIEKMLKDQERRAEDDVVGLALEQSVINGLNAPMGVEGGVNGLISGLSEMKQNTELIKQEYGPQYTDLISKADAKEWNDWFENPQIPVVDKLAMVTKIAQEHPDQMENVFNQIGGKDSGMLVFASSLSTSGNTRAAELSLLGMTSGAVLEPGFAPSVSTHIGNAYAGYTGLGKGTAEGIVNYNKGVISQTEEGGTGYNVKEATTKSIGEIVTWNGQNTILPVGVSKGDFTSKLDKIELPDRPNLQRGLRDLSDSWSSGDYQLRHAGSGQYYVRQRGDNPRMVKNADGSLFVLTWGEF